MNLRPFLSVALGLILSLMVVSAIGENPLHVLAVLGKSAAGSPYDLGLTLFYATPLVFTGLSVALAFRVGLFNVGAEGQLLMGAISAAAVGIWFPHVPAPLSFGLATVAAFAGGAVWGGIAGVLKAYRGSHEVINTIMLNFIASALTSFLTLYVFKNPETQNPETRMIGESYLFSHWGFFQGAPISSALIFALASVAVVYFFLARSVTGFRMRAVGSNEHAARAAGIAVDRMQVLALALSGGIAGLVALPEILGNAGKFKMGFSADYGFIGIAVALLGRGRAWGVVISALLFATLHKGSTSLDLETEHVTKDFSFIIQGIIILCVSADALWERKTRKKK